MAAEKVLMVRGGMKIFTRQKGLPEKWNPYTIIGVKFCQTRKMMCAAVRFLAALFLNKFL